MTTDKRKIVRSGDILRKQKGIRPLTKDESKSIRDAGRRIVEQIKQEKEAEIKKRRDEAQLDTLSATLIEVIFLTSQYTAASMHGASDYADKAFEKLTKKTEELKAQFSFLNERVRRLEWNNIRLR